MLFSYFQATSYCSVQFWHHYQVLEVKAKKQLSYVTTSCFLHICYSALHLGDHSTRHAFQSYLSLNLYYSFQFLFLSVSILQGMRLSLKPWVLCLCCGVSRLRKKRWWCRSCVSRSLASVYPAGPSELHRRVTRLSHTSMWRGSHLPWIRLQAAEGDCYDVPVGSPAAKPAHSFWWSSARGQRESREGWTFWSMTILLFFNPATPQS